MLPQASKSGPGIPVPAKSPGPGVPGTVPDIWAISRPRLKTGDKDFDPSQSKDLAEFAPPELFVVAVVGHMGVMTGRKHKAQQSGVPHRRRASPTSARLARC